MEETNKTCCFFGHREIDATEDLQDRLYMAIEKLIVEKGVNRFLLGSKSKFNSLCYRVVTKVKENYPDITRVYVRSSYQHISEDYKEYLLEGYEETYYPEKIANSGKASYVERNQEMIDKSDFCIVYYDENYLPPRRRNSRRDLTDYQPNSGTKIAYDYAVRKKKNIINMVIV